MHALLPAGLTVRPVRYDGPHVEPAELAALHDLAARCDVAVLGEVDGGPAETAEMLESSDSDRDAGQVVVDGADRPVGFLYVEHEDSGRETFVDVYADPDRPDRDALLDWGLATGVSAGRAHAAAVPGDGWTLRAGAYAADPSYGPALDRAGFLAVRRFWRMHVDTASSAVPASAPDPRAGVSVETVVDEDGLRALWHVLDASFAEHWNHTSRTFEDWRARVLESPAVDVAGLWLVRVDGTPAAGCVLDESRADVGEGYVRSLGVLREFRGQGLGRLLLQRAFVRYRDLGRAGVRLTVDSENTTGATALYESVGMRSVRVIDAYELRSP